MGLSTTTKDALINVLKVSLKKKMRDYKPEASYMPFHTRLLGKDRMALFSFIQSLNTNFGTSIFEPVAKEIALNRFDSAIIHIKTPSLISSEAQYVIQEIMEDLRSSRTKPDKTKEIEAIRKVCRMGNMNTITPTVVDLLVTSSDAGMYLFDLKTAKPNKGGFQEFKRTMLEWVAVMLASDPETNVHTCIAIPYNPYHPKPYSRWTMAGMLDVNQELKVAEEFWDFLGGEGAYEDLLAIFEVVGIELRPEIDEYFRRFTGPTTN